MLSKANFAYQRVDTAFFGGVNQLSSSSQTAGGLTGDLNGDGLQDILEYHGVPGTDIRWSWRKRTTEISPSIDAAEPYDDKVWAPQQELPALTNLTPDKVTLIDVNGDGREEIVFYAGGSMQGLDVTGQLPFFDWHSLYAPVATDIDLKLVDLNGDGLIDIVSNGVVSREDNLYYRLNNGRKFLVPVSMQVGLTAAALPLAEVLDFDGDGRHELLIPRQGGVGKYVGLDVVTADFGSTGTPTFSRTATTVGFVPSTVEELEKQGTRVVDADGVGQQDVLLVDRALQTLKLYVHNGGSDGTKPDLLRRVREGTANPAAGEQLPPTVEVTYAPLADNNVYFNGSCPRAPTTACAVGGMHVVKQVRRDAGLNDAPTAALVSDYFYRGGRISKRARSFLGFADRRVSTRSTTGAHQPVTTKTFYTNAAPATDPRPVEQWTYATVPGGQQSLQRTDLNYADKSTGVGTSFSYLSFRQERSYQFPGYCCLASAGPADLDALGHQPHRTETELTDLVDAYGNAGLRTRSVAAGGTSSLTKVSTVPDVDATQWLVHRPARVTTEDSAKDGSGGTVVRTRTSEFGYVAGTDRVAQEKRYATATDRGQELTTAYQYDVEGNVVRTTATDVKTGLVRESTAGYDPLGYPHATMNAVGHVSRTGHDPVTGALKVAVDVNGLRVDLTYDSLGRPVRTRRPSGAESTVSYAFEQRGTELLPRTESLPASDAARTPTTRRSPTRPSRSPAGSSGTGATGTTRSATRPSVRTRR